MMKNQVSNVRSYLRSLARKRASRTVTADDVHMFWRNNRVRPSIPQQLSVINSVFADSSFKRTSWVASTRSEARYRQISQYSVR